MPEHRFMKGQFFEPFIDKLDGGYDYIDYYYDTSPYPCDNDCCQNYKEQPFFIGIINAGYFLFREQSMGFGTFLANFANFDSALPNQAHILTKFNQGLAKFGQS